MSQVIRIISGCRRFEAIPANSYGILSPVLMRVVKLNRKYSVLSSSERMLLARLMPISVKYLKAYSRFLLAPYSYGT